jgi:hypothetical protein
MTSETARAIGELLERAIRPTVTLIFVFTICWIGVRSINNISADQFVGIVMAVILFWFASRSSSPPTTTTTTPEGTTTTTVPPGTSQSTVVIAREKETP